MAYTINLTDGTILTTVADGTINTDTSMVIIGKNYAGYGEFLGENFVRLLENSANATAPANPLRGQLWFDTSDGVLKVYNGSTFKNLGSAATSATAPATGVVGDLWFDPVNSQLNVYDGANWILVGPSFTAGTGTTGAIPDIIADTIAVDHIVVKFYVEDDIVGILSKDAAFTPGTPIPGFTQIFPGFNLATSIGGETLEFVGTATDSNALGGLASSQYLRSDANDTTSGTLKILNDVGLYVGADDDGRLYVDTVDLYLQNQTNNGDIHFRVNDGGVNKTVLTIDGPSGKALLYGDPTVNLGVATKQYVDNSITTAIGGGITGVLKADGSVDIAGILRPDANNTRDLGTSVRKFATVYATTFNGTSTTAQYADLAERFASDEAYAPGTVVELGGEAEITKAVNELSDRVFGVISSQAAYLMNAAAGDDVTHPAVAMNGRVPVRVIGKVRKGDRLVSAGAGLARAVKEDEAVTSFHVIGRSLEDKTTSGEGVVEAVVRIN
jgi:hypothetical protein